MDKKILFLLLVMNCSALAAQEKERKFSLNGYVTSMQSAMFDTLSGPVIYDNLIHNRLNFKLWAGDNFTITAELRNRLFTGDMVRSGSSYAMMTGTDQGLIDMSWNLIEENSFFLNTTIDRLLVDLKLGKWQISAGRQRINWGQTFVWNPNDVFNAYSFFDFDYTEKPGSDALRLQYYSSYSSAFELAAKLDSDKELTAAALYRFSKGTYDIQFLAGWSNGSDLLAGAGWSGSIGPVSFRGEGTWFHPLGSDERTFGTAIITMGADRVFENNSILQMQVMYCNEPLKLYNFSSFYSGNLSAKDLAFSEFSAFGSFTWAATPLLNITLSSMWFPDLKGFFAGPSLDYSMAENLDFSFIWQHFNSIMNDARTRINLGFLRFKYSF
jgi:hypothetical protein